MSIRGDRLLRFRFRFGLLIFAAAILFGIIHAEVPHGIAKYGGPEGQALLWETVSRARVFCALHFLFASLCLVSVGWMLLFGFCSAGRWWVLGGVIGLLMYYRLDPRFRPEEWRQLARAVFLLGSGAASYRIGNLAGSAGDHGSRLWRGVSVLLVFACCVAASNLLVFGSITSTWPSLSLNFSLFNAGLLLFAAFCGSERQFFAQAVPQISIAAGPSRTSIIASLAALTLLFIASFAFFLPGSPADRMLTAGLAPLVSPAAGLYGAYSWFQLPGPPTVFAMGDSAAQSGELARLYLSLFFEYLTVFFLVCLVAALRHPRRRALVWLAHVALLLYLLPSVWTLKPAPQAEPAPQIALNRVETPDIAVTGAA